MVTRGAVAAENGVRLPAVLFLLLFAIVCPCSARLSKSGEDQKTTTYGTEFASTVGTPTVEPGSRSRVIFLAS